MTNAAERVFEILLEEGCLPYAARIRDIVPEERPATTEKELTQLRWADAEADRKNREFCARTVAACQQEAGE